MKKLIQWTLRKCGYELRKTSTVGLDVFNDVQGILGARTLQTLFDVGAHIGETAVGWAARFPQAVIHSFEPSGPSFEQLRANVRRFPKVKPVNLALGERNGCENLHVNAFSATNSLLAAAPQIGDPTTKDLLACARQVSIQVSTVDTYCQENGIEFLDVLKMDVQGFELHVLRGAERLLKEQRIAFIFTEVSFETLYEGQAALPELYARVSERGFQLVDLYGQVRNAHHGIRWCDLLFVNPAALAE